MITLGRILVHQWWIGKLATCTRCGRQIEFEMGDDQGRYWMPTMNPDKVAFTCEGCGNIVLLGEGDAP